MLNDLINLKRDGALFLLIVIVGLAVYGNSLSGEFLWDDNVLIVNNPHIKSPLRLPALMTQSLFGHYDPSDTFYRPVQALTYMTDYSIWRLRPFGYHLTNTLLHIITAILAYLLILQLSRDRLIADSASLLFLVHPVNTAAVAYISGRADTLATSFMLLSSIFYIQYRTLSPENNKKLSLSLIFFGIALLCKESALMLPLIFLAYDLIFKRDGTKKNRLAPYLGVFGIICVYLLVRKAVFHSLGTHIPTETALLGQRLLTGAAAFGIYMRLLFAPVGLHMEWKIAQPQSVMDGRVLLALAILGVLIWTALKMRRKAKGVSFGFLWYLIGVSTVSGILPLNAPLAEHWLYLPCIGFFFALISLVSYFVKGYSGRRIFIGILAIAIFIFSILTIDRNRDWLTSTSFYQKTLESAADSDRIHSNLGLQYQREGRFEAAIEEYKKALAMNPANHKTRSNLATSYVRIGDLDAALTEYKYILQEDPDMAGVYSNVGNIYHMKKDYDNAIKYHTRAIQLKKDSPNFYNNLGVAYMATKRYEEAVGLFEEAVSLDPDYLSAWNNLGDSYYRLGDNKKALSAWKKALRLGSDKKSIERKIELVESASE
ncbi:MAG: tetratricopeptide repeat protein [Candidatus Omnitrophica bacterium]|nr:tetratricopeptide repeat protein [Candidatus Omnitrophota bacterium]